MLSVGKSSESSLCDQGLSSSQRKNGIGTTTVVSIVLTTFGPSPGGIIRTRPCSYTCHARTLPLEWKSCLVRSCDTFSAAICKRFQKAQPKPCPLFTASYRPRSRRLRMLGKQLHWGGPWFSRRKMFILFS